MVKNNSEDKKLVENIIDAINQLADKNYNFMEVCGTHTMAIAKFGLRSILPKNIKLLSGPGCPVCVTPIEIIDAVIELSLKPKVIIVTFGDMMRVPGSKYSLEESRSRGGNINTIYSPGEILEIAKKNPDKEIVFVGVGFETTSPTIAASIKRAYNLKIKNISVIPGFKLVPPMLRSILENPKIKINGFLLPGHVSTIIGSEVYDFIPEEYKIPCVIGGFEAFDILLSILYLLEQYKNNSFFVRNQYTHGGVTEAGNRTAMAVLNEVFEPADDNWRAIGIIPGSGLKFRDEYMEFDALEKFGLKIVTSETPAGCICGNILLGVSSPFDCKAFGNKCTPSKPVGPCMVSSEGACAAYYKYK